jgi:hypothetical protein
MMVHYYMGFVQYLRSQLLGQQGRLTRTSTFLFGVEIEIGTVGLGVEIEYDAFLFLVDSLVMYLIVVFCVALFLAWSTIITIHHVSIQFSKFPLLKGPYVRFKFHLIVQSVHVI